MAPLLSLSRLIDTISTWVGKFTMWLILATTLISAGNALVRKIFNQSAPTACWKSSGICLQPFSCWVQVTAC